MTNTNTVKILKLNNRNYQTWKFKVELLLVKEDLWDTISKETPDPVTDAWKTKDGKARASIGLLVEDNQLHIIRKQTTAKGSWEELRKYHQKATLSSKVNLLKKLCALRLTEHGDMANHLAEMENVTDQLTSLGETLAEHLMVAFFLSSLPDSYATLITALESRPEEDLTVELVKNKLLEEYSRRESNSSIQADQGQRVLKTTKQERDSKTVLTCYFCKKPNHVKKDCRKYIQWKSKNPGHTAKTLKEKVADDESTEQSVFSCFKIREKNIKNVWHIDSGATAHMSSNKNLFKNFDSKYKGEVLLANGYKIQTAGSGNIFLHFIKDDGEIHVAKLCDVLYVPQLKGNLLSVKKLTNKGFLVLFEGNKCSIIKSKETIAVAEDKNGLFELRIKEQTNEAKETNMAQVAQSCTGCIHVWHNRMGHRNSQAILNMVNQSKASWIAIKACNYTKECECCIQSKMTRKAFPKKSESKTTEILDLIHTDVCGPMQTVTPGGKKYFMTMIDDYSKYTEVYLLSNKSEVPDKIKEYVRYVQTKFRKTPKKIRSDRGGEYTATRLQTFKKSEGIQAEYTNPYSPQKNGCAERKNRYIVEMTRCMLNDAGLPSQYWGEALITANHLQNRLPVEGKDITPYEAWNKRTPNLDYIKVFGSTAYMMITADKRQKLDDKAKKLTFVGYERGTKGYRLLDVNTNKVYISKDVTFIEKDPHQQATTNADRLHEQEQEGLIQLNETQPTPESENLMADPHDTDTSTNVRRSERTNKAKPPERLIEVIEKVTTDPLEPKSFKEVISSEQGIFWREAMDKEMKSLSSNKTWELSNLPENKTAIGSKWVYKIKRDENGNVSRYKARLVAQGYSQKFGDDYDEVFAPVAKTSS